MAEAFMGSEADRLPWLNDKVSRPRRSSNWVVPFVAASVVAIIAAFSFWLGMNGGLRPATTVQSSSEASFELPPADSRITLPEQEPVVPEVELTPASPTVDMVAQQDVRLEAPPVRRVARQATVTVHRAHPRKSVAAKKKAVEDVATLKYASPWKSTGVSGRMVRVGAYSSMEKGKEAWSTLAQLSPAIKQLPAVVTDIPSPTGRTLYWLQIGTTSQAHSEVLCQRMKAMGQRCVVVDVAGARKDGGNGRQPAGI